MINGKPSLYFDVRRHSDSALAAQNKTRSEFELFRLETNPDVIDKVIYFFGFWQSPAL